MATQGSLNSATTVASGPAASDADCAAQTISTVDVLGNTVALGASTQTAITNIIADLNDLKAKMRSAGILAA